MHVGRTTLLLALLLVLTTPPATAQDAAAPPTLSAGDTAWVLVSAALVMLMVPGLALFYGGMVRHKNVLSTLLQCLVILGVVSVQFAVVGYTLAFGPDKGGLIGGLDYAFLQGIRPNDPAPLAPTVPHLAFVLFQMMFAAITPALIVGAFVERFRFKAVLLFSVLWSTLVYAPVAHSVWGGGWLARQGALDFAGGTVVHLTAGIAALACALYVGRRRGFGSMAMPPNNIPLTVLGAGLLWFGWFGFNAGSALAAGGLAASAFAATHLAAAAACLSWCAVEWRAKGKPTAIGAASGLVAGLVAVTPASGFVTPMSALVIGLAAGPLCYGAVAFTKSVLKLDDSLDAFGVHGVGGAWGAIATGLLATPAINALAATGLFATADGGFGLTTSGTALLWDQAVAVAVVAAFAFLVTFALLWVTDKLVGLRVPAEAEQVGLDLYEHGEKAYSQSDLPAPVTTVVRFGGHDGVTKPSAERREELVRIDARLLDDLEKGAASHVLARMVGNADLSAITMGEPDMASALVHWEESEVGKTSRDLPIRERPKAERGRHVSTLTVDTDTDRMKESGSRSSSINRMASLMFSSASAFVSP